MLHRSTGTIFIEDNVFSLGDRDDPRSPLHIAGAFPTPDTTGLLATAPGFVAVKLPPAPDGDFRVRDSVRHRDAGEDRGPNDPIEHHLIQIWPDTPHSDELLKATDKTGALWRDHRRR
ncbi:hypothetical protein ACFQ68_38635 [Amycolatopsis japonica]|uniref:hypothetical protein n=1 Tax=Amycolatopsis japonica TaxID=208439 RepID=UPI00366D5C77